MHKPKVLKIKIEVAKLLRNHPNFNEDKVYVKTYWKGNIRFNYISIYVYFQYYVRRIGLVDYVSIRTNSTPSKELTKKELLNIKSELLK